MSGPGSERGRWRAALQAIISALFLALVFFLIDEDILLARIAGMDPLWVGIALLTTLPQFALSAARWRLTAERLGAVISYRTALAEYYLAVLTNQILPGGVLGDAVRAVRHGKRLRQRDQAVAYGPAVRAVVYERASGQFVLFFVMLAGLAFWPRGGEAAAPILHLAGIALLVLAVAALALVAVFKGPMARTKLGAGTRGVLAEAVHALLSPQIVLWQLFYSLGVLATYLFCFYCAARALGLVLSFNEVVSYVPAILFAMTVPITIGGWGIREAAAAAIWGLASLTPAEGVAISVTYGIIILLSALPGILFVLPKSGERNIGNER